MVTRFIDANGDKNIDIECVGRKGRDFLRRRYPIAAQSQSADENKPRAGRIQIVGEHIGVLGKVEFRFASELGRTIVERFSRAEADSVYILYNEFKSVIAQRLIVQNVLPIKEIGAEDVRMSEEAAQEEKKRRLEAAKTAGVGIRPLDTAATDEAAAKFGLTFVAPQVA